MTCFGLTFESANTAARRSAESCILRAMVSEETCLQAQAILEACRKAGLKLATAESCTGGLIAACLTDIAGSSDVFERGFVTYSNTAKTEMLGVPAKLITTRGAVSEEVAIAMAEGALAHSEAQISVAVTGIAGPGGGSVEKPVGLVHIAAARTGMDTKHSKNLFGALTRRQIREKTVITAFAMLNDTLRI